MGEQNEHMELTVGAVVEGKVKSLTKFGAFVALPDGSTGMVHISEIAHAYVNDIREHLTEGQDVKVMIISRENGKTNLSIKRTLPAPSKPQFSRPQSRSFNGAQRSAGPSAERSSAPRQAGASASQPQQKSFDDMLKQFMTESSSKMSSIKQYSEHKTKTRRR
ncbi:MAG: S1 RNA-binding domain-containing protein [Oscillospiraceae bacterium]